jgi:hypothetical protein
MVHFKASSVLLFAFVAGCAQDVVVAKKYLSRDLAGTQFSSRELDARDRYIRAVVKEALSGRSSSSEYSELESRELVDVQERSPVDFFKHVGEFVKRAVSDYWQGMKREVSFLDFRQPHGNGKALQTRDEPRQHTRRRFESGQMEARDDTPRHRRHRRRFANGQQVEERHHLDSYYKQRRRRFANDEIQRRDLSDSGRHYRHRRRFSNGDIVERQVEEDIEARDDASEVLPRMSWFGKALLIYRDVGQNPPVRQRAAPGDNNPIYQRVKRSLEDLD